MHSIEKTKVTSSEDGKDIFVFRLTNTHGNYVELTNIGASIMKVCLKDRDQILRDIVLGYDSPLEYFNNPAYMGCVVGRTAGRIEAAVFEVDKEKFVLEKNNENNCLHGGFNSISHSVFEAKIIEEDGSLRFSYLSKDMENGFPGNLKIEVSYSFTDNNKLILNYLASTDKACPVNLTNHAYFNLNGHENANVEGHTFKFNSDKYSILNDESIPLRDEKVDLSPFDFRTAKPLSESIAKEDEQLEKAGGFDHNFVINKDSNISSIEEAAEVYSDVTGIKLKMYTTEKCFQFYTGNYLNEEIIGKDKHPYNIRQGFCLEAQSWPNGINNKNYESSLLRENDSYQQTTIYEFSVDS